MTNCFDGKNVAPHPSLARPPPPAARRGVCHARVVAGWRVRRAWLAVRASGGEGSIARHDRPAWVLTVGQSVTGTAMHRAFVTHRVSRPSAFASCVAINLPFSCVALAGLARYHPPHTFPAAWLPETCDAIHRHLRQRILEALNPLDQPSYTAIRLHCLLLLHRIIDLDSVRPAVTTCRRTVVVCRIRTFTASATSCSRTASTHPLTDAPNTFAFTTSSWPIFPLPPQLGQLLPDDHAQRMNETPTTHTTASCR